MKLFKIFFSILFIVVLSSCSSHKKEEPKTQIKTKSIYIEKTITTKATSKDQEFINSVLPKDLQDKITGDNLKLSPPLFPSIMNEVLNPKTETIYIESIKAFADLPKGMSFNKVKIQAKDDNRKSIVYIGMYNAEVYSISKIEYNDIVKNDNPVFKKYIYNKIIQDLKDDTEPKKLIVKNISSNDKIWKDITIVKEIQTPTKQRSQMLLRARLILINNNLYKVEYVSPITDNNIQKRADNFLNSIKINKK